MALWPGMGGRWGSGYEGAEGGGPQAWEGGCWEPPVMEEKKDGSRCVRRDAGEEDASKAKKKKS